MIFSILYKLSISFMILTVSMIMIMISDTNTDVSNNTVVVNIII